MRDLDFDELDKAVKAVMQETNSPVAGSASDPVPVTVSPVAVAKPTATPTTTSTVRQGSLIGGSKESFKPKVRSRLFMDVKPPAGKGRQVVSASGVDRMIEDIKERPSLESNVNKIDTDTVIDNSWTTASGAADEPKTPFKDTFASLQGEVDALVMDMEHGESTAKASSIDRGRNEFDDDGTSSLPFLSSVGINKRPLGGYAESIATSPPAESIDRKQSVSEDDKVDKMSDNFYGADPLADMTIEDIDATIIDPKGAVSVADIKPVTNSDLADKTLSELGDRIQHELKGRSSDDVGGVEALNLGKEDEPRVKKDSFHESTPAYQEEDVIDDFDAKFADVVIEDTEDLTLRTSSPVIEVTPQPEVAPASSKLESKIKPDIVSEISKKVSDHTLEGVIKRPIDRGVGSEEIGGMTVSPGDNSVSVEQVAAMEETIASKTEWPVQPSAAKARTRIGRLPSAKKSNDKTRATSPILSDIGPGSIQPQYKTAKSVVATSDSEYVAFNPDSFVMPVGNKVNSSKSFSPLVLVVVSIIAVLIGVGGAFALFHSGVL